MWRRARPRVRAHTLVIGIGIGTGTGAGASYRRAEKKRARRIEWAWCSLFGSMPLSLTLFFVMFASQRLWLCTARRMLICLYRKTMKHAGRSFPNST
jgi:hypothetical protein